jgi:hypothetical protein
VVIDARAGKEQAGIQQRGAMDLLFGVQEDDMKSKLLGVFLLAGSSLFARGHFSIGIGVGVGG